MEREIGRQQTRESGDLKPFQQVDIAFLEFSDASTETCGEDKCRIDRFSRFKSDLEIYRAILSDEGKNIQVIENSAQRFSDVFKNASPNRQKELAGELIQAVNIKLRGRFNQDLNLFHELLREDGTQDGVKAGEDQKTWRELFENSSRKDRLEIARAVREKTENLLIQKFEDYLAAWRQSLLSNPTISPEEAAQQIDKLKEAFDNASRKGQIGLSKQLRERIDASSSGKFSALLELYSKLLKQNGHNMNPDELPKPQEWIERYTSALAPEKKHVIINQLQNRISLLITARSK